MPVDVKSEGIEGQVFLIYIPRKYPILHQAVKRGKYYKRTEFTSSPMSNFEIETAFKLAYNYEERINSLLQNRLQKLNIGEYHINIPNQTRILVHLISIDALDKNNSFNLEIVFKDFMHFLKPLGCTIGKNVKRNLQGILVSCGPDPNSGNYVGYVQLYRKGMIEVIDSFLMKPTTHLHGMHFNKPVKILGMWFLEKNIIDSCKMYLKTLETIGTGLPIFLYISFIHMKDYKISLISYKSSIYIKESEVIKRDEITLPRIKIDSFDINFEKKLKSSFDIFWNAFNIKGSRNYDRNGNFINNLFK